MHPDVVACSSLFSIPTYCKLDEANKARHKKILAQTEAWFADRGRGIGNADLVQGQSERGESGEIRH